MLFQLLSYLLTRIKFIDHIEQTQKLSVMTWECLELVDQVRSLFRLKKSKLVDVFAIAEFCQFQCVLLELEGLQKLKDWKVAYL